MHVLVTGGAGFIGAHTVRALAVQSGVTRITVLDDLSSGRPARLEGLPLDLVTGSVLDADLLKELTGGVDAVLHLAARVSVPKSVADPAETFHVNVTGTFNVLDAVRVHGGRAHVVLASSAAVYGPTPPIPTVETAPTAPASPYAASKLAAEAWTDAYARCYGFPALVLRFFNVFGPLQGVDHDYAAVVPAFVEAALAGRSLTVHGDGSQTRDFVSAADVASVLSSAVAERVSSEVPVNLAVGHHLSVLELITAIEVVLGRRLERRHDQARPGDVRDSRADTTRLSRLLPGRTATPMNEALAATIAWAESVRAGPVT